MKAITIWQPWASLIACGAKKFETRSWATSYRGPIAIHAAQKNPHSIIIELPGTIVKAIYDSLYTNLGIQSGALNKMSTGCIVATAELVCCRKIYRANGRGVSSRDICIVKEGNVIEVSDEEYMFGDWTPGRYAWEIANVKMLPEPIPAKGKQGLWNWEEINDKR